MLSVMAGAQSFSGRVAGGARGLKDELLERHGDHFPAALHEHAEVLAELLEGRELVGRLDPLDLGERHLTQLFHNHFNGHAGL
jgi:hypothetical protein